MSGYKKINDVGSPRVHLLNILLSNNVFSEFYKEGFTKLDKEDVGYYFSQELINKEFDLKNCMRGKTSAEFMEKTGYTRPKINNYIERYGRIVYLGFGFYNFDKFKNFLLSGHMQKYIEKRGRPKKSV